MRTFPADYNLTESKTIAWLHISDFHIKDGDSWDRDTVLRALTDSVRDMREREGRQPDLIFATGDIAHAGKASQYQRATDFFDRLLDAVGLDKTRLFVVPGNHDVDRDKGDMLVRTLGTVQASHEFFGSADKIGMYQAKLSAFRDWYNGYFLGERILDVTTTCQIPVVLKVNGLRISVAQINSALFCQGDDDHGKLWIGRRCLEPIAKSMQASDADIRVALIHHPLEWLHDGERTNTRALLRDNFDAILRGHLHETDVETVAGLTGSALHLACGAAYQGSQWPNRVTYGTAHFDAGTVTVHPLRYEDSPRPIWTIDPSVFPRQPDYDGVFSVTWKTKPAKAWPPNP